MKLNVREVKNDPATFKIIVGGDVICPCCGQGELYNPHEPVSDWRWRIRPNKVESGGIWWSECTDCSLWFGSDDSVELTEKTPRKTLQMLKERGYAIPAELYQE